MLETSAEMQNVRYLRCFHQNWSCPTIYYKIIQKLNAMEIRSAAQKYEQNYMDTRPQEFKHVQKLLLVEFP